MTTFEPNEETNIETFFYVLVKFIYDTTRVSSVTYRGRTYRNRSNCWYNGSDEGERESYDPDIYCDGYMDGCSYVESDDESEVESADSTRFALPPESVIHVPDSTSIVYNLKFDISYADGDYFEDNEDLHTIYNMLMEKCEGKTLADVKLRFGDLHLVNPCGFNEDHRGSDHTMIKLDFHDDYELSDECSLEEFADACYRVKSHKFDYWYELFSDCSSVRDEDSNKVTLTIDFDHGS